MAGIDCDAGGWRSVPGTAGTVYGGAELAFAGGDFDIDDSDRGVVPARRSQCGSAPDIYGQWSDHDLHGRFAGGADRRNPATSLSADDIAAVGGGAVGHERAGV